MEPRFTRWCRRVVHAAGMLVPADRRVEWRREWDAELRWYGLDPSQPGHLPQRSRFELLRRSAGAWRHAAALRREAWSIDLLQDVRYAFRSLLLRPGNQAYGFANWEYRIPNSRSTRFGIASITKTMSEALVEVLAAAGRIRAVRGDAANVGYIEICLYSILVSTRRRHSLVPITEK